jgi:hypothetical protein
MLRDTLRRAFAEPIMDHWKLVVLSLGWVSRNEVQCILLFIAANKLSITYGTCAMHPENKSSRLSKHRTGHYVGASVGMQNTTIFSHELLLLVKYILSRIRI